MDNKKCIRVDLNDVCVIKENEEGVIESDSPEYLKRIYGLVGEKVIKFEDLWCLRGVYYHFDRENSYELTTNTQTNIQDYYNKHLVFYEPFVKGASFRLFATRECKMSDALKAYKLIRDNGLEDLYYDAIQFIYSCDKTFDSQARENFDKELQLSKK